MQTDIKRFPIFILLLLALVSCSKTDYMTYDPSLNGIYFNHDTLVYSFAVTPVEQTTYELRVPVKIMGTTSHDARSFSYLVESVMPSDQVLGKIYVPRSTSYQWAEQGVHYSIPQQVTIPADTIGSYIPITIHRQALQGNYLEGYQHYRLVIRLTANEYFSPTLSEADQVRIVEFDNAVDMPAWYNAYGEKEWYESRYGVWHPFKLIKMVDYFHTLADILPETYMDMVELYGENLEHIPYGYPDQYSTVFRKYIYKPMFDYFESHHDEILEMYPDFPFDFPNPF